MNEPNQPIEPTTDLGDDASLGRSARRRRRHEQRPPNRVGGVTAGLMLVLIGVLLALRKLDLMTADPFHQLWPLALVVVGVAKLFGRTGRVLSGWGVWLVLVGFWFLADNFEVFGPSRVLTGPVVIVITGLVLVLKSFDGQSAVSAR